MSKYKDSDGNDCTLRQLVINEPDWAVSRLTVCVYSQKEVDMLLQKQQKRCANNIITTLKDIGFQVYESGEARIRDACLNATGERDDYAK